MSFRVILLDRAEADIEANARWWAAHHSTEQAARWLNVVQRQLQSLKDFPESHGLSAENDHFPYTIRDKLLGLGSRPGYRAIFTVKNDTVYILTVRRASQDVVRPSDVEWLPSD